MMDGGREAGWLGIGQTRATKFKIPLHAVTPKYVTSENTSLIINYSYRVSRASKKENTAAMRVMYKKMAIQQDSKVDEGSVR